MNTSKKTEWLAVLLALLLGVPLTTVFALSFAHGHTRHRLAPISAVVGSETLRTWMEGKATQTHYWGDNRSAPLFTLPDHTGTPWSLEAHRGKTIVLNFWTKTCQPCLEEMPSLIALSKRAPKKWGDVEVVTISTDKNWQEVSALFEKPLTLKVLFDPEKKVVGEKFGTRLFPETWIIDKQGVIRFRYDGALDWSSPIALDLIESFL